MTIPTDATHEAFIHDLDVVRVDVRMSALEPGLRTLVEKLSQELHVARAELAAGRAVRDEYLEELNEIRHLLGAGPGVTALEAVKLAQKEAARLDGDEWARAKVLDDIRAAIGIDARGPGLVGAVRGVVAARASAEARARDALERGAAVQVEAETARGERDLALGVLDNIRFALATEVRNSHLVSLVRGVAQERKQFMRERDEARSELTGLQDVNVAVRSIVGIGNGESLTTAVSRLVDRLRGLESAIRTLGSVLP